MSAPPRPIVVRGRPLAAGALPAVCIPLVGRDDAELLAQARAAVPLAPDLLEWRVDFHPAVGDPARAAVLAARLREAANGIPVLFTRRSPREGGQPSTLADAQVLALYTAVCASGHVDLVDVETATGGAHIGAVRASAHAAGVGLVLSFHDFDRTPPAQELLARYRQAADAGADVAKIAVMPQSPADVLALLQATWDASRSLAIPVAGMAMGPLGIVSRVGGGVFGSALTFAVGQAASAPGQVPIAELRATMRVLRPGG